MAPSGSRQNEVVMNTIPESECFDAIVIGGGQAGLSVGYYLARQGMRFVILDASPRIGDAWRNRWDSLRLFTPARFDGLAGMPFPGDPDAFPTKNEMADYLEAYARHFALPVRTGVTIDRLWREGDTYFVSAGHRRFEAPHIVVAMSSYQKPRVPAFARQLDPSIVQLHSLEYRRPEQLRDGGVLIAGAGNSGAEIGVEVARRHRTWLSGRNPGEVPWRSDSRLAQRLLLPFLFRVIFHRVLTVDTPMGRKARPGIISKGGVLIRTKSRQLANAGVERAPRIAGVRNGKPLLDDGRVLEVSNVIWCTGFDNGMSWIELPIFEKDGEPRHRRGIADEEPGLYFVGLHFLYSMSSTMIHGVSRDAERIVSTIVERRRVGAPRTSSAPESRARVAAMTNGVGADFSRP
jgi:putative flavoprotein involved in K+ transport